MRLALVLAALAAAPPAPRPAGWPVAELVVSAARAPVFWRVARGEAEVWILGVPPVFARGQAWDATRLRRLLGTARVLLTPAEYVLEGGSRPKPRTPPPSLEARLPPDLAARVAAARTAAGQPAARYADLPTLDAAFRLRSDLYRAAGLSTDEPDAAVRHAAYWAGVPMRPVARYAESFATRVQAEPAGEACLEGALADAAFARAHAAAASRAWARGDLRTVRENTAEPTVATCLDHAPAFADLSERSVADTAAAIEDELASGGRAVAVLTLGALVQHGGVLDRLRTAGAQVTAPQG